MHKIPLLGQTLSELTQLAKDLGMPAFTGKQLAEWIYSKRVCSIDEMTNISVRNRTLLNQTYEVGRYAPVQQQASVDGTVKFLFKTQKGHLIESVFIPEDDRATLCISSQVGCKMNCLFCMTGKQGFTANLTAHEILNQFYSIPQSEELTNIVFMGMGEPFDNLENVMKTNTILSADYGIGWSPKRITVSSIGLIPKMKVFLDNSDCHLAISMHSPFDEERLRLMPVQKPYPISSVINELKNYDFSKQRRVSFEYIMFNGVNDTQRHAAEIVRMLKGITCRVNLIRFHAIPNIDLQTSPDDKMIAFRDYLTNNGVMTTIRKSRGEDIFAACGMLSSTHNKENL
ncbi:MAG: 23S rRNA (adenine(2503)-C(2))-methyltransferase RlmN [Bacteroidales bacterium]|nr:23S rRNA (adenine(2503)-C(2))-methyltransferase RlmN [Bacteroidales bacterium]